MPVKRRIDKRNNAGPPATAWEMVFASGYDYLGDLLPFGIRDDAAAREAAQDAWKRHGAAFMANWVPTAAQPLPWAAVAFPESGER